MYNHGEHNRMG
jgi:hypothetical protein